MSADQPLPAPVLDWLEQVDARWRTAGLDVALRARMGADLVEDLRAALLSGASMGDLVDGDADEFADQLAAAYGRSGPPVRSPRPTARDVVLTGLLGGAVGGVLVWLVLLPGLFEALFSGVTSGAGEVVAVAVVLSLSGAAALASILGAIRYRYAADPDIRRTIVFVGVGVLVFGLLSIAPAMGLAWMTNYDSSAGGVTLVGLLILGFVAAGIRIGHWVAERTRPSARPRPLVSA